MPIPCSLSPLFFNLVRTLLHFFALPKNSTLLFSSDSALCVKKHNHRGWERRTSCQRKIRDEFLSLHHYFITSLLPLARGNSVGSAGGIFGNGSRSRGVRPHGAGTLTFHS